MTSLEVFGAATSGVGSPEILGGPKKFCGAKMFDFRRITLFCLEKRLSKHKMTIFSENLWGMAPLPPLATPMATTILACFENFVKSRFIVIGKSAITLYISCLKRKKIFNFLDTQNLL